VQASDREATFARIRDTKEGHPNLGGVVLDESSLSPTGVDAAQFRAALRRHANGVVVVTAAAQGQVAGLTVTSLVSLSLEPPLVCFAVSTAASAYPVLAACGTFEINFLAAEQAAIAARFATKGIDRFAPPTRWDRLPSGEPVLLDAPAHLRCEVSDRLVTGDHVLMIGRVLDTATRRPHEPLVYHEGSYASVRRPARSGGAGAPAWWTQWWRRGRRHGAAKPGKGH
jgi:flavin reductase (DIM6/NTAB) family NADH-FMN oxidoreductase RutF